MGNGREHFNSLRPKSGRIEISVYIIIGNVWKTVRRICIFISGLKGLI